MNNLPLNKLGTQPKDLALQDLAIAAQQYPSQSRERQRVLGMLIDAILRSGELWQPDNGQFSKDIYQDARQDLFLYLCQKIEKYDPERGSLITWLNVLMYKRFFREAVAKAVDNHTEKVLTISSLDNFVLIEPKISLFEMLRECVKSDSENIFKSEHVENYPQANFQLLLILRFAGSSWQDISNELGIKPSTIKNFYQRCIKKFAFKFKEYLQQ